MTPNGTTRTIQSFRSKRFIWKARPVDSLGDGKWWVSQKWSSALTEKRARAKAAKVALPHSVARFIERQT